MKVDFRTRNYEADDKLKTYLTDKIGSLERYLPRKVRAVAKAEVFLEEDPSGREDNRYVCEVVMTLPGGKFVSREGTLNMYAAIDIVEAKISSQIRTYKDKHIARPRRAKILARLLGRAEQEALVAE